MASLWPTELDNFGKGVMAAFPAQLPMLCIMPRGIKDLREQPVHHLAAKVMRQQRYSLIYQAWWNLSLPDLCQLNSATTNPGLKFPMCNVVFFFFFLFWFRNLHRQNSLKEGTCLVKREVSAVVDTVFLTYSFEIQLTYSSAAFASREGRTAISATVMCKCYHY